MVLQDACAEVKQPGMTLYGKLQSTLANDILMLLLGLLYCAFTATLTYLSVLYVTRRVNDYKNLLGTPLPDLLFGWVSENFVFFKYAEFFLQILVFFNVIMIIFHNKRLLIMKRLFVIIGTIYLLRFATTFVTFFPVPNDPSFCPKEGFNKRGIWGLIKDIGPALLTMGMMKAGMASCGDSMFSGHTAMMVLLASNIGFYLPQRFYLLKVLSWLIAIVSCTMIPMSHQHYTMDVVFGAWISRHVFTIYHHIVFAQELYTVALENISGDNIDVGLIMIPDVVDNPEDQNECRVLTSSIFWRHFGLVYWMNPLFAYFEKDAFYQPDKIAVPFSIEDLQRLRQRVSLFFTTVCCKCFSSSASSSHTQNTLA